jgi:hypothetical protein
MLQLEEGDRAGFAAAMLRVVLALKREPNSDLEELVERAIGETGVDAGRFRRFLATHSRVMARTMAWRN